MNLVKSELFSDKLKKLHLLGKGVTLTVDELKKLKEILNNVNIQDYGKFKKEKRRL